MRIMTDYTATRKIASYEVNLFGQLRLSAILRICQEVAEEHLTSYGMDHVTLMEKENLAFLILRVGMKFHRLPKDGETITIRTQPEGNAGVQLYRSFEIGTGNEKLMDIMYANVLVDSRTHKLMSPDRLHQMGVDIKQTLLPKRKLGKLKMPQEPERWGIREIRFSDLDFNGHLSNSIYGNIIEDYLPHNCMEEGHIEKRALSNLQINYIKEMKLKDKMLIQGIETEQQFAMAGVADGQRGFECAGTYCAK